MKLSLNARYYDGKTSQFKNVEVKPTKYSWVINYYDENGQLIQREWNVDNIKNDAVSFGNVLTIKYNEFPYETLEFNNKQDIEFLQENFPQLFKAKEINFFFRMGIFGIIFSLFLIVFFVFLSYKYLIPSFAYVMANNFPQSYEEKLGNTILDTYTKTMSFNNEKSKQLNQYAQLIDFNSKYNLKFQVVDNDIVNAFALPGGNIIVFEGILQEMENEEELAGLLAHEVTHVEEKHVTKNLFKTLSSYLFISIITSDVNAISAVLIENANAFSNLSYSRNLEKEADLYGIKILKQNNINPNGMVWLMETLNEQNDKFTIPEFLSSHPLTKDRIIYLKKEAKTIKYTKSSDNNKVKRQKLFKQLTSK